MDNRQSWYTWLSTLTLSVIMVKLFQSVVVITGASSGIGESLAHEFYRLGCKVVLCARRKLELERRIIDVTGHIDILINNGGISCRGSINNTTIDVFKNLMTVNYLGTVAFTKEILPHMIQRQQGHIAFMSSIQGLIAIPYRAAYAATKHALQAFGDSLRAEIANDNIYVTVLSPGYVRTALSINALTESGDKTWKNGFSDQSRLRS
ncbi:hypothetical protein FQR65_LT17911 [Abscondita terminalis]|nr:hypothetical protein FQR65_LT17911 [Abscondita terminalis]